MDITEAALDSCETYHMDYLCENLHLTTDIHMLSCAVAIFIDSTETTSLQPTELNSIIQQQCNVTYHEVLNPTPTTLQTQDEIFLANFQTYSWQLLCKEISDRLSTFHGALYTIINLDDLCTCGITSPQGRFLYESMRTCDNPDTDVTLYYTYNRPLISYDHSINVTLAKRYAKTPYPFRALDLEYHRHEPYLTSNGSLHMRLKRHSPDDKDYMKALEAQSFPLSEAIRKMETKENTYIGSFFPMNLPLNAEEPHEDAVYMEFATHVVKTKVEKTLLDLVNTPVPNFIFNKCFGPLLFANIAKTLPPSGRVA